MNVWKDDDWLWKKVNECWKIMKWKNGEKWIECWSGSVIENEKMCVEMLKDVKGVECKKMLKDLEFWKCKKNNDGNVNKLDLEKADENRKLRRIFWYLGALSLVKKWRRSDINVVNEIKIII